MTRSDSRYSQTKGIKLLQTAIQQFGPIFTIEQIKPIAQAQQLSISHLRFLISSLADAGWIEIIKRGTYVVTSSLYSGEIPSFAIAGALLQPLMISHWSACTHHGFTSQNPTMIQASTPRKITTPEMRSGKANNPRGRAIWKAFGLEIEFIHIKQENFWGFTDEWINSWQQIKITDPERTALDLIARSDIFGGISAAIEILENAVNQIEVDRLVEYSIKYNSGSVIKRMGWILENLGVSHEMLEPLQKYPVKKYFLLDSTHENFQHKNSFWNILENLKRT